MAARVNIRFVIFLVIGLILLAGGVIYAGAIALRKSGPEYAALGDKFMQQAAGEVEQAKKDAAHEKAVEYYSKAVSKKQSNVEWIEKWIGALETLTPTPQQTYVDRYKQEYMLAMAGLTNSAPQDVAVQRRYLDWVRNRVRIFSPGEVERWEDLVKEADGIIGHFEDQSKATLLRRYRAMGRLEEVRIQGLARTENLLDQAREDFEAVLKADPADMDSVVGLASIKAMKGAALREKDPAEGEKLLQEGREMLKAYARDHPPASFAMLSLLQIDFNEAVRVGANKQTYDQLYSGLKDQFLGLVKAVKEEKTENFDPQVAVSAALAAARSPNIGSEGASQFLEELLLKYKDDPLLLMTRGQMYLRLRKGDQAMQDFQKVADMPTLPLSLKGIQLFGLRAEAMQNQVMAKLAEIVPGMKSEDRQKLVDEAKKYRQRLAEYTGEDETAILLLDARIMLAQNNPSAARIKLEKYNEKTENKSIDAVAIMGEVMLQGGNPGEAKKQFELILKRDENNYGALQRLAEIAFEQEDWGAAVRHYQQIVNIQPSNEEAKKSLATAQQLKDCDTATDPVIRVLCAVQKLTRGLNPQYKEASDLIKQELPKNNYDARLYPLLAQLLDRQNDRAGVVSVLEEGLAKHPDDKMIAAMKSQYNAEADTLEIIIKRIEDSPMSAAEKAVNKAIQYRRYNKTVEARAELKKAADLEPANFKVLELQFTEAIVAKNLEEAKRLAGVAAAAGEKHEGADNVGGLTFRARVEMAEGRAADAATTLEQALEKDKLNVPAWRLLGALRLSMGQYEAAAKAYTRAVEIRTGDVESITGLLRAKIGLRQYDEALTFARQMEAIAGRDPEFVDVWLTLEAATAKGDKKKALEGRQQFAKKYPDNQGNNAALVALMIDDKQFAQSRKIIDELKTKAPTAPRYMELEAQWNLAQQNLKAAVDVFNAFEKSLPEGQASDELYIRMASLLLRYGQTEVALIALEDGRKHQDPKTMRVDRELAEVYFSLGRHDKAIEVFDRVLQNKPDDAAYLNTRLVSSLFRMGRLNDAKARLDALGTMGTSNQTLMLLKADIVAGLGNSEAAMDLYNQAVALKKDDAFAFTKRGDFLMRERGREKDAEDDLKQALAIDQRSYLARQRLAGLYLRLQRFKDAAEVLKQGITLDPENDDLRVDLINAHLLAKDEEQAFVTFQQALERKPNNTAWLMRGRELMGTLKRPNDAAEYAGKLWEQSKTIPNGLAYVDAILKTEKPNFNAAMQVFATPELETGKNPRLLLARAKVYVKRGRSAEATEDMKEAMRLIDQSKLDQVGPYFTGIAAIYPAVADQLTALRVLMPKDGGYKSWFAVFYARLKTQSEETREDGLATLKKIGEGSEQTGVRVGAYAAIGAYQHAIKKTDEALAAWRKGLEIDANEPELNNNVAYTLASELDKPQEALPYADKAAQALPNSSAVLDTLGTVYIALKKMDKAEEALLKAHAYADSEDERGAIYLHMGQLRLAQGNKADASRYMQALADLMARNDKIKDAMNDDFKALKAKLDGP